MVPKGNGIGPNLAINWPYFPNFPSSISSPTAHSVQHSPATSPGASSTHSQRSFHFHFAASVSNLRKSGVNMVKNIPHNIRRSSLAMVRIRGFQIFCKKNLQFFTLVSAFLLKFYIPIHRFGRKIVEKLEIVGMVKKQRAQKQLLL